MGLAGLVDTVLNHRPVDMDGDDFAERQPGLRLVAVGALQLDDLRQPAFERHRAFGDAGHIDELAGYGGETRDIEFIDVTGDVGRGGVHLLRQIHGGEIPDEFPGLLDILDAVLPGGGGKADQWWMVAERVEEAVGRQIDMALAVARRNPPDQIGRASCRERV